MMNAGSDLKTEETKPPKVEITKKETTPRTAPKKQVPKPGSLEAELEGLGTTELPPLHQIKETKEKELPLEAKAPPKKTASSPGLGALLQSAKGGIQRKASTIEQSKSDWKKFRTDSNLVDELEHNRKDGYVFLLPFTDSINRF